MDSPYNEIVEFVTSNGVSQAEAEVAVGNCLKAMAKYALGAYVAGGAVAYFMRMSPNTAIPWLVVSTAAGAGYALAKAPQCSEIREAIAFWERANF